MTTGKLGVWGPGGAARDYGAILARSSQSILL